MKNIQNIYPLSPMQKGMLFHSLYAAESEVYTEQFSCKLEGKLNIDAFHQAWQEILNRHDILRSAFVWENLDEPLQVVQTEVKLPFVSFDWQDKNKEQQKAEFEKLCIWERRKGFEFTSPPLMKMFIIQISKESYYFLLIHHHLLFDGWSLPVVFKEMFQLYTSFNTGEEIHLFPTRPYSDYIAWLQNQDMEKAREFWKDQLKGFFAPTTINFSNQQNNDKGYKKKRIVFSKELSQALNNLSKENKITLNTIYQGVLSLLLSRYSNSEDVLFGATVSGRPPELPGVETMVGLFINTLPIRVFIDRNSSFLDWLVERQAQTAQIHQFEYSPLVDIHGWSQVPRDMPLFNCLFVFENYPVNSITEKNENPIALTELSSIEKTNYPLTVVAASGEQLALDIAYETTHFTNINIENILNHFNLVFRQLVENPQKKLSQISLLSEVEKSKILDDWNKTEVKFPEYSSIQELFEDIVTKNKREIAILFNGQEITYDDLNSQANQLAHYLRKKGIGPEFLVGISLDRSIEMIVSVLAVLKAGGAYVPLDPENPPERLDFMISDSNIELLITHSKFSNKFDVNQTNLVRIDDEWNNILNESITNLDYISNPQNLAYVIYTSGSTGTPKATMLQHWGVFNLVNYQRKAFGILKGDHILQFASMSFDASVWEFMMALMNGAKLVLEERKKLMTGEGLYNVLSSQHISIVTLPPSAVTYLPDSNLPELRLMITAGERCSKNIIDKFGKERNFFNGYGPTETTVCASFHLFDNDNYSESTIGQPVDNTKLYVLDHEINPVPVEIPGELCISGISLARGYLNRPDLTAEKFIPNPFSSDPGERMYRTGDLVRYLPDGNIEFIGRIDHQIKIRGFRIELGEIEVVIKDELSIQDVVIILQEYDQGEKRLIAYYVSTNGEIDLINLRSNLKNRLPDYMIPATFVKMESLPLTPNGKVDRKALPEPEKLGYSSELEYIAPRTPEEELIASILSDILKIEKMSVSNSFFDLGGHSLLATQVVSRIREAFQIDFQIRDLFENPTVSGLALKIEIYRKSDSDLKLPPLEPVTRDQELPLSFAQQRLWFLDQLEPGSISYNIPSALKIHGRLNVEILENCIQILTKRHESLRTTFPNERGKPIQKISPDSDFYLEILDISKIAENEREVESTKLVQKEFQTSFDLINGPLFRVNLIKLSDEDFIFLINMHHIISDGWSMGVMISEIAQLYRASSLDEPFQLSELEIQYADFSLWQRTWLDGDALEKQVNYWKNQLAGYPQLLEFPTDKPRPAVQTFNGATENFQFSKTLSNSIMKLSRKEGVTPFMTLLSVFQTLLHRYSGQSEILVGSPVANRTHSKLENIIGFFVNTLVFKADFSNRLEFSELLRKTRETCLGAYAHQDLPFEKLVEELHPMRDLSHSPIFQVAFVLQNLPTQTVLEMPDLKFSAFSGEGNTSKYDMTLTMSDTGDFYFGSLEYNTDLFEKESIFRFIDHYKSLLENLVNDPALNVAEVSILGDNEKEKLLIDWNRSQGKFLKDKCVHERFEELAETNPQNLAVIFKKDIKSDVTELTYDELNSKANQLAYYLRKLNIGQEKVVGISLQRSPEMIISMLAILKTGAAYVPIDPNYPKDRIQYMIHDSGASVVLTDLVTKDLLPSDSVQLICVDSDWAKIFSEPSTNLGLNVDPENLAYVIYTSGSTGKPKGTMLRHRGALNLSAAQIENFKVGSESRIMQFASLSFDAATWEFIMALLSGASLVLTSQDTIMSGDELTELVDDQKVTTITIPPSVLAVWPENQLPNLKTIITAGEAVSSELEEKWKTDRQFFNAYGPTETTVCCSMFQCDHHYPKGPPIGTPISNFQLYVLDAYLQPVPIGVPGELCVSGTGLARGYMNRPDLTSEKFIPNPFDEKGGSRLYRTGDLVRYLPDGNIEYLGRIDSQVKVRGFRIELGEIQAVLERNELVKDTVVLIREDIKGDKRIVAYVVCESSEDMDSLQLKDYLKNELPEFMVPAAIVRLEEMPLTPNGKIDRNALPMPEISREELGVEFVEPRNETEEKLVNIGLELLKIEKIGVFDNFFDLGGHSLLATQFMSRVREEFGVELQLRILFEKPIIADLAIEIELALKRNGEVEQPSIKRISRESRRIKRSELL